MLVEYQVVNFGSYKDPVSLNMQTTEEQRFCDRVSQFEPHYHMTISPIAAIFGANASGKSIIIQSLSLLASTVRENTGITWQQDYIFPLDPSMRNEPTLFKLVFLLNEKMYSYFLAVRNNTVIEEYLASLTTNQEILLFERTMDGTKFGEAWEGDGLLAEVAATTPKTGTLAGRIADILGVNENYVELCSAYRFMQKIIWVSSDLDHSYTPKIHDTDGFATALNALDTGVAGLHFTPLSPNNQPFPLTELGSMGSQIGELSVKDGRLYSSFPDENGGFTVTHIRFRHHNGDAHEYLLDWHQESHGVQKIIMLLPWLWAAVRQEESLVLLVDDLADGLHSQLAGALIQEFLEACTNHTRAQLVFTTHNTLLMDCDYLRLDEIWITDKSVEGESILVGLPEYRNLKPGEDIREDYVAGRFGGTPHLDGFTFA